MCVEMYQEYFFYDSTSLTCIVEICNESEITARKKRTIKVAERKKEFKYNVEFLIFIYHRSIYI